MRHRLIIGVSREPPDREIVTCRHVTIRERFIRFLLGDKRKLTVIVPGTSVRTLSIEEERGKGDEQN